MNPMTTGTIGSESRTELSRQPMVTFEKRFHPIRGKVVFGVQPLRCVAMTADISRNLEGRAAFKGHNPMFGMTIRARGCIPISSGQSGAMDALRDIFGCLLVTRAARLRQFRKMKGRSKGTWRQDRVTIVAIGAGG